MNDNERETVSSRVKGALTKRSEYESALEASLFELMRQKGRRQLNKEEICTHAGRSSDPLYKAHHADFLKFVNTEIQKWYLERGRPIKKVKPTTPDDQKILELNEELEKTKAELRLNQEALNLLSIMLESALQNKRGRVVPLQPLSPVQRKSKS